ncbi:1-deoxy-D-xylulose-5-phosphate synthase [Paludisphaera mucosa]|uniref:1-deoxy-D-xylulose-5-phosphate synthase n=1 Tax=Paludisphaera mucosa TaxID=3030827 RepID=A0ABT6FER1_9BACT|nr:1-deoxy-D-xylulose-5-phosphate synthase [Paludisphaera mucosa]MDG3006029.1 1-deoxy-D-xylulose-5-phosphate synthase [Paludisphaera mucosa]
MLSPDSILSRIGSPADLKTLTDKDLDLLAAEMRAELLGVVGRRAAHFASNLGVVELCLALHLTFDFARDRLIWDTGHQIYPHKLITGRAAELHTIRTKGGLMGYPNPAESPYDLFMTGHAGCAPSTALGLKLGDEIMGRDDAHSVAVIGDGAFPSGIVFEALNHASGSQSKLLVILNDNKMSICPPVGGIANTLDRARMSKTYHDWNKRLKSLVPTIPLVGETADRWLQQFKDAIKATLQHGMLFEELGFTYLGPIDGHDLKGLRTYLEKVKAMSGPILLHVLTNKGQGFEPAVKDPVKFHAPNPFRKAKEGIVPLKVSSGETYTDAFSSALFDACANDPRVVVLTAAMCEGNKLQKVRETFPKQFLDVGICESHAVALAGGMAKAGARPVVDIYSTFLQRSYDQIFQEVALQNLPVVFCLDRAGLVGADGPTHHGSYDLAYMRVFPNMVVMAPGDRRDVGPMLDFALGHDAPVSIRYPRAYLESVERDAAPIELGQAEVIEWESDGMIVACGAMLGACVRAAERLHDRYGLHVGVINARFVKPLDRATIGKAIEEAGFVLTVEEGCLPGGFGSAVLEAANDAGLPTHHVRRLGLPDRFVLHAERDEQLAEVGLDVDGITAAALELARAVGLEFTDLGPASATEPGAASSNGDAHSNGSAVVAGSPSEK